MAAQEPSYSKAGFACHPRGTLDGSPTTTLSTLNVDFGSPSRSTLLCMFRGTSVPTSFGGPCAYEDGAVRVEFGRRVLINLFGTARLLCWDGTVTAKFTLLDDCEPVSFNAALGDGSCSRDGTTTFDQFIAELQATQDAHAWRNVPSTVQLNAGRPTEIQNSGGEVHTLTRVATFGGGFVVELNGASSNPVPAPECLNFASIVFIPAGLRLWARPLAPRTFPLARLASSAASIPGCGPRSW